MFQINGQHIYNTTKAMVIPQAREFYEDKGFVETDGSGEMILTPNAAQMFILDQEQRQLQPFD